MSLPMPTIMQGDARSLPLDTDSVDLIVTSPPYFNLRSYRDNGEHYGAQIGSESTVDDYVSALLSVTRECQRVLKSSGSLWVNLGDKYSAAPSGPRTLDSAHVVEWNERRDATTYDVPRKSLVGIPWRYAIRCVDELGLTLRAEVIWSKPNGLPESVTDRVRRSHEHWFHFVQSPRYFSALDELRQPTGDRRPGLSYAQRRAGLGRVYGEHNAHGITSGGVGMAARPFGTLPGSVWEVATQPLCVPDWLGVDHFAAFPMELPRRIVLGWSPPRGVVLDPFGGTGTTALVATMLGRDGISLDASSDYGRIAEWRASDPVERARAAGVDTQNVARDSAAQADLLDLLDEGSTT